MHKRYFRNHHLPTDQILELLLHHHADPNLKDDLGHTPLHRAASRGNLKCVKLLLEHSNKIELDARDIVGNTSLY